MFIHSFKVDLPYTFKIIKTLVCEIICYWYQFLQNLFLHMLVKFQRIILKTFWDIVFKPKAPIFQIAQILDYRQSATTNARHPLNVGHLPINQYRPFKNSSIKAKVQHIDSAATFN